MRSSKTTAEMLDLSHKKKWLGDIGTPVKSVTSGTVIKAGSASGYGIAVYVNQGGN